MRFLRVLLLCLLLAPSAVPASACCEAPAAADACPIPETCPVSLCGECRPATLSARSLPDPPPVAPLTAVRPRANPRAALAPANADRATPGTGTPPHLRFTALRL